MTVEEFYKWCKERHLEDAELEVFNPFYLAPYSVTEQNIDYHVKKEPHKPKQKAVIVGR